MLTMYASMKFILELYILFKFNVTRGCFNAQNLLQKLNSIALDFLLFITVSFQNSEKSLVALCYSACFIKPLFLRKMYKHVTIRVENF